jgi:hypothetical protein
MSLVLVWGMRDAPPSRARGFALGLSLAAVALGRPEGIAVSLTLLCAAAFVRRGRDLGLAAAPLVVLFGGYQIFRLAYFGDWIANAARAKAIDLPVGARLADAATYVIESAQQWMAAALVATWLIVCSPDRFSFSSLPAVATTCWEPVSCSRRSPCLLWRAASRHLPRAGACGLPR